MTICTVTTVMPHQGMYSLCLQNMLENNGDAPTKPFEKYELLRPAHEFKNRHDSILLVLDAAKNAFVQN